MVSTSLLDIYTHMLRHNTRCFRSISVMGEIIELLSQELSKPKPDLSDTMVVAIINITCIEVSMARFII